MLHIRDARHEVVQMQFRSIVALTPHTRFCTKSPKTPFELFDLFDSFFV